MHARFGNFFGGEQTHDRFPSHPVAIITAECVVLKYYYDIIKPAADFILKYFTYL